MKTLTLIRSILSAATGFLICLTVAGLGLYLLDETRRNRRSRRPIHLNA